MKHRRKLIEFATTGVTLAATGTAAAAWWTAFAEAIQPTAMVWKYNPCGVLHAWNPLVDCDDA